MVTTLVYLLIYMYFHPLFRNDLDIAVNVKVEKITILWTFLYILHQLKTNLKSMPCSQM